MPRGPVSFRQSDLTRALRAAKHAGLEVSGYEIESGTGNIVVHIGHKPPQTREEIGKAAFDEWLAKHRPEC
jgi:hypothetical protein